MDHTEHLSPDLAPAYHKSHYGTQTPDRPLPEQTAAQEPNSVDRLLSLVHTQETSGQLYGAEVDDRDLMPNPLYSVEPITLEETEFRHSAWKPNRSRVWACMRRAWNAGAMGTHRLNRFSNCGSATYVQMTPDRTKLRLVGNYCHDRLCQPCQAAKARVAAQVIARHVDGKLVRFVTLTVRHSHTPLAAQIRRILAAFHQLRRTDFWRRNVTGGAYFFEVKWIPASKTWHPHLHILAETQWLPQKELSQAWHAITGDSYVVDVRPIHDGSELANYVTKYCGKAVDNAVYLDPAALNEYVIAIRGVRVLSTFGTWRGLKLRPKADASVKWINVGRLDNLISRARHGEAHARRWLEAIMRLPISCEDSNAQRTPPPHHDT